MHVPEMYSAAARKFSENLVLGWRWNVGSVEVARQNAAVSRAELEALHGRRGACEHARPIETAQHGANEAPIPGLFSCLVVGGHEIGGIAARRPDAQRRIKRFLCAAQGKFIQIVASQRVARR